MSQIKKKFIENNAIDGTKFQLLNGQTMRAVDTLGVDRDLFYFNSSNEWQFSVTPKLSVDPQGNNDLVRKSYVDSEVSAEESARIAAVSAEESARISADNALDARLDIIEGADTVEGSVAKAEKDAKDYTDAEVADEASLRTTADQALQAQIDTINDVLHEKEKFVLTGTNITNGYINLAHEVIEKSLLVTVDRLVAHAGDDYTVSVVSGVTRITFAGSLASGEDEELVAGDIVRVMYRYQS